MPNDVAGLVGTATVLGLPYFGRDVLIPITLAFILNFLIAPVVRAPGAPADARPGLPASSRTPVPVEVHEPALKPLQLLGKIIASVWPPLDSGATGKIFFV